MKKIFALLTLSLLMLTASAQTLKIDWRQVGSTIDTFNITTTDTSWVFDVSADYTGGIQVDYSGLTGTLDGTLAIQQSYNGVTFATMGIDSHTMSGASGTAIFEFEYLVAEKLKIVFTRNSITGGKISVNARFIRKHK